VVLPFHDNEISQAILYRQDEEAVSEEVSRVEWPSSAATMQATMFPDLDMVIPETSEHSEAMNVFAMRAEFFAWLGLLEKAADTEGLELFAPKAENQPLKARCGAHKPTIWTAVIMPMRAVDLGKEREAEAEVNRKTRAPKVDKRQAKMPGVDDGVQGAVDKFRGDMQRVADETGATIKAGFEGETHTIAEPRGKSKAKATKSRREKAKSKTGKKAGKKK
jgi:hypothetical protein